LSYFRSHDNGAPRALPKTDTSVPSACPACQSKSIATTTKAPDESSYWRCAGCGEVWNVSRRRTVRGGSQWR